MKHLTDKQIFSLAETVVSSRRFSRADELAMLHIANCPSCYELLKCMMAVMEITNHMDEVVSIPAAEPAADHTPAESGAIIKIVVLNVTAMLEQLRKEASEWDFNEAFALSGVRSDQDDYADISAIEDNNSDSSISYDPATRTLLIQIDGHGLSAAPRACLKYADGRRQDIVFNKQANIYCAEVHDLEDGEYQLILNK